MILTVCSPGHVADAVRIAADSLGEVLRAATISDPDLFMHALGCRTIVYAAEPRLLDAPQAGDPDRMRAVVRAAHAPGVERVVVVFPVGEAWEAEARVLRKDGVGYTILHSRPLVDELADATNFHATRSVWLPRGQSVALVPQARLSATLRDAITRDDLCGATLEVPAERMEIVEAIRRAAGVAGAGLRVHAASPSISFAMRKLTTWMGHAPPDLEGIFDRLTERGPTAVANGLP